MLLQSLGNLIWLKALETAFSAAQTSYEEQLRGLKENTEKSLKELIQDMRIVVQSLREDVAKMLEEFENNSTMNQKK